MSCWKGLGKLPRQTLQERNVLCFKNILFCLFAGFGNLLFRVQMQAISLLQYYEYYVYSSNRVRSLPPLSFEETERRVLLMKKWSAYKQSQDRAEKQAIRSLVEAQQEALKELRLESEELYQAAIRRDEGLFPFERDGPNYTPPLPGYDPPEGKCIDITKVYTQ